MINLLPPEVKAELNAARANRLLLRYNILLLGAIVFLLGAIGLVYVYLGSSKTFAEQTIEDNIARAGDFSMVEASANTFIKDLANAKQLLENDVKYTKVILEIARVLPGGVVLGTLNLDSATFGSPTTLAADVKDYETVLVLKDSLQASSVFSKVSIQSISANDRADYPLNAVFSVTIEKEIAG